MATQHYLAPQSGYFPVLKGIAIAGSLWNAGSMTTAFRLLPSIYPTIQQSRRLATKEWAYYYWTLSRTVPLTDLATILACSGLAYLERKDSPNALGWKLWATAAGIMPIGWVWVWALMLKPSNQLLAISDSPDTGVNAKVSEQAEALDLLKRFNALMGVRMMFPWIVGSLALWASLGA